MHSFVSSRAGRWLAALALVLSSAVWAAAQPAPVVDPVFLESMKYRNIGPFRGGRVTAVSGVPQQMHTFYMGSTGGGVWRTEDAGQTWRNLTDGQLKSGSIGAIAVAPSDPNVIYVGTGSACPRGNVSAGDGIYRVDRRRKDLDAHRTPGSRPDREDPRPSRRTRTWSTRPCSDTSSDPTRIAVSTDPRTGARTGRRSST